MPLRKEVRIPLCFVANYELNQQTAKLASNSETNFREGMSLLSEKFSLSKNSAYEVSAIMD